LSFPRRRESIHGRTIVSGKVMAHHYLKCFGV
jgi:hypothetical protein